MEPGASKRSLALVGFAAGLLTVILIFLVLR
jgi:hypothetical protein